MGDISIKGRSPILRQGYAIGGAVQGLGRIARRLKGRKGKEKDFKTHGKDVPTMAKKGGWIQKATASIKKRGTKGKCTPITKPGCTGRAKALAKTFKKMAKKRKAA